MAITLTVASVVSSDVVSSTIYHHSDRDIDYVGCPPIASAALSKAAADADGSCRCNSLLEIHCQRLKSIPDFGSAISSAGPDHSPTFSLVSIQRQAIGEVKKGAFVSVKVTRIVLNFNPIGSRLDPLAFLGLEQILQELSLGGCQIRTLHEGLLVGMTALQYLHLWANQIDRIPAGFFRDSISLKVLNLWGNRIRDVTEESLRGLRNLERLDLSGNMLKSLRREAFQEMVHLRQISLSGNRINAFLSDTFSNLSNLKVLNLDRNGLGFLHSKAFRGVDKLLSLALNDNYIRFLPDGVFANLDRLILLDLHNNDLEYVWTKTFSGLRSLHTLNLSGNRLKNLPDGVFSHSALLVNIFLDRNKLNTLRRCILAGANNPRVLSLIGNLVQCDCRLAWIRQQADNGTTVWGNCDHQHHHRAHQQPETDYRPTLQQLQSQHLSIANPLSYIAASPPDGVQHCSTGSDLSNECRLL